MRTHQCLLCLEWLEYDLFELRAEYASLEATRYRELHFRLTYQDETMPG